MFAEFSAFSLNLLLNSFFLFAKQREVGYLSLQQLNLQLFGLNFLLVLLHAFTRSANFVFDHIKFRDHTLNLTTQLITILLSRIIHFLSPFCIFKLGSYLLVDVASISNFDIFYFIIVFEHFFLILGFSLVVFFDFGLDFLSEIIVEVKLTLTIVLFLCEFVLNHSHSLLKACSKL